MKLRQKMKLWLQKCKHHKIVNHQVVKQKNKLNNQLKMNFKPMHPQQVELSI